MEWIRWVAASDLFVMIICGALMRRSHQQSVPRVLDLLALVYGLVFTACAAGVIANIFSPFPVTPGAKVVATVATPAALVTVWLTTRALRLKS